LHSPLKAIRHMLAAWRLTVSDLTDRLLQIKGRTVLRLFCF
jgi:hypothetical protein